MHGEFGEAMMIADALGVPRDVAARRILGFAFWQRLDHLMARAGTSEPGPAGMPVFFVTAPTGEWRPW